MGVISAALCTLIKFCCVLTYPLYIIVILGTACSEHVVSVSEGKFPEEKSILKKKQYFIIVSVFSEACVVVVDSFKGKTDYLFVCLIPWRYNPLWLYSYFHSPVAGFNLLVFEVS